MESTSSLFNVLYPQKQGKIGVFLFSYHFSCFLTGCFLFKSKKFRNFPYPFGKELVEDPANLAGPTQQKKRFYKRVELYTRVAAFI